MARIIDITDKLAFDENPMLVINGQSFEVNADAATMLKVVNGFALKDEATAATDALNIIFSEENVEKILTMKKDGRPLSAQSLMTIISEAMDLVMGDSEGE